MALSTIRNKEDWLTGTEKNRDGSPVQEVVDDDGDVEATITNKEDWLTGTERNKDGTPVQEVEKEE